MSSKIELCSNACLLIGCSPIASLTESSDRAILMANIYDQVRLAALRRHPWNCAKEMVLLSPDTVTPPFQWPYQFQLPGDCVRVLSVGEEGEHPDYRIRGRLIMSDETSIKLEYIKNTDDPNTYDALFNDYLCARLAFTAAYPLTKDSGLQKAMAVLMEQNLKDARLVDGLEEPPQQIDDSPILRARRGDGLGNTDGF